MDGKLATRIIENRRVRTKIDEPRREKLDQRNATQRNVYLPENDVINFLPPNLFVSRLLYDTLFRFNNYCTFPSIRGPMNFIRTYSYFVVRRF